MFARAEDTRLSLERDGSNWPNREASRMIKAGRLCWHFQLMGNGPALLLIHGTGAATHSWRAMAPLLARRFTVLAPDLPGHGFTGSKDSATQSLVGMSRALNALLKELRFAPDIAVGHSAGAAILARLCLNGVIEPKLLVALNGAFAPLEGLAGYLLPSMAKLLFLNPFAPRFFAWTTDRAAVSRLLRGTGSEIDEEGVDYYARLFRNPAHVAGALGMMANWDLLALHRELPRLAAATALIVGAKDKAVPPLAARMSAARMPNAFVERLEGLGHLAHEEQPALVAAIILRFAEQTGIFAAA
jgi:magnesium chelatase accessory protein